MPAIHALPVTLNRAMNITSVATTPTTAPSVLRTNHVRKHAAECLTCLVPASSRVAEDHIALRSRCVMLVLALLLIFGMATGSNAQSNIQYRSGPERGTGL